MLCTCSNPSHVISMRSISTGGLQALGSLAGFLSDLTSFYFSSPSLPPAILAFPLCLKCARPLPSSRPCTYCFLYLKPRDTMSPSFPHSHLCINFPDSAYPFPTHAFIKWHSNTLYPLPCFIYFSHHF